MKYDIKTHLLPVLMGPTWNKYTTADTETHWQHLAGATFMYKICACAAEWIVTEPYDCTLATFINCLLVLKQQEYKSMSV